MSGRRTILVGLTLALAAGHAQAALRQFSYDPADSATREASGPVTLLINQTLFGARVLKLRSTEAKATADLRLADPGRLPGEARGARGIYRVSESDDGAAFVAALCPGSKRAWLAFSAVKYGAELKAVVFGDDQVGPGVRVCRRLVYDFHGEWRLPPGVSPKLEADEPPDFPQ